jgi:hypothetical protein
MKHNGYGWMVRTPDDFGTNSVCGGATFYIDACITHLRYQVHALAAMPDALTHTHSMWLEARICDVESDGRDNSRCGIYRGGGHIKFGRLGVNRTSVTEPGQQELLPFFYTDGPADFNNSGIRLHGSMATDDVRASARDFTWYPEERPSVLGIVGSNFGPLFYVPQNTSYNAGGYSITGPNWSQIRRELFYCQDPTRCRWPNGGQAEAHFVIIRTREGQLEDGGPYDTDRQVNGYFSYQGYTNRWGQFQTNNQCTNKPLGVDCVPVSYEHVPVNQPGYEAQHRDSSKNIPMYNYDIAPAGEYWIQFPN